MRDEVADDLVSQVHLQYFQFFTHLKIFHEYIGCASIADLLLLQDPLMMGGASIANSPLALSRGPVRRRLVMQLGRRRSRCISEPILVGNDLLVVHFCVCCVFDHQ